MPCLEISMPEIETDKKELLARKLTEAFTSATRFEAEIFGIRFFEYRHGDTASGGELWKGGDSRPYLHFLLYCPRLRHTARRKVVESFTSVFTEVLDKPNWKPVVHICDIPIRMSELRAHCCPTAIRSWPKSHFIMIRLTADRPQMLGYTISDFPSAKTCACQ